MIYKRRKRNLEMELLYSHKVVSACNMTIQTTFRKRPTKKCMRRLGQLLTRVESQEARTSYKPHFGRKFIACNFQVTIFLICVKFHVVVGDKRSLQT